MSYQYLLHHNPPVEQEHLAYELFKMYLKEGHTPRASAQKAFDAAAAFLHESEKRK